MAREPERIEVVVTPGMAAMLRAVVLVEIWPYVGRDDRAAADRLLGRSDEQARLLVGTALVDRLRPEVAPDARSREEEGAPCQEAALVAP